MAGESQQEPKTGAPDPSTRTVEQQQTGLDAERDWAKGQVEVIKTRLDAMDKATIVLNDTVTRTPTEIQKEVGHLRELAFTEIKGLRRETKLREGHRLELKTDSEKALLAALSASKEAANKTEVTFGEALKQQATTYSVGIAAITTSIDDLKTAITELRSEKKGGGDTIRAIYGFAGFVVALIVIGGLVAAFGGFTGK